MNREFLLSVVIPTRNRLNYVKYSILSVLNVPTPHLQLVVEDNSDSDHLHTWIDQHISDPRLVYNHSTAPIPMVENYERATSRARAEYVCLIGDDDGVSPEIIDAAVWARAEHLDALVSSTPAHYVWPDLHLRSSTSIRAGELRVGEFTDRLAFPEAEVEMLRCARDAGQSFHSLPKAYYGIVKRTCLERVKEKTGTFFPGVSPDMAVALAVANYVDRMCWIDYPLFIPGSSARSNAGISGMGKHIGRLSDQPHLPTTVEQDWSHIVPRFYSVETMWAESAVGALKRTGRTDLLAKFNVARVYADCAMWHPEFLGLILGTFYSALASARQPAIEGTLRFAGRFGYLAWLRAKSLLGRLAIGHAIPDDAKRFANLENIEVAVKTFSVYLAETGRRFPGRIA